MCFIAIHSVGDSEVSYLLSAVIFVTTGAAGEVSYLLSAVIFVTTGAAVNCVLVKSAFFGA